MSDCTNNGHDWAPVGVYVSGVIHVPCLRKDCCAEMRQSWEMVEGPGMSIDGMPLDIEDDPQGGVAKTVCREAQGMYNDLDLKPGDVVVDIGAHVGIISIYLAKRYPGIRVLAYEPVQANYDRMMRNIAANKAEGINAINMAVTGDGRTVWVVGNLGVNSGGCNVYLPGGQRATSTTLGGIMYAWEFNMADLLPLPNKVPLFDRIALLKIDCEGAEYEILQANETLLNRVTYLRGEFHENAERGWNPDELLALCHRHIKPENIKLSRSRV